MESHLIDPLSKGNCRRENGNWDCELAHVNWHMFRRQKLGDHKMERL